MWRVFVEIVTYSEFSLQANLVIQISEW